MGNRRMISKTVTQTQRFLQMPLEAQALYFHLIQNSDDDGIVESFSIVRMIGASEDSLKLLHAKDFVRPLNDEMVYYIVDFHEQNTIQKHHYRSSRYQNLLNIEEKKKNPRIEHTKNEIKGECYQNVNKVLTKSYPDTNQIEVNSDNNGENPANVNKMLTKSYPNISQVNSIKGNDDFVIIEADDGKNPIFEKLKSAFGELAINGTTVQEVNDLLKIHGERLLLHALDKTILNAGKSIRYTRAILERWQGQGLKTPEQVEQNEQAYQAKKARGQVIQPTAPKERNYMTDEELAAPQVDMSAEEAAELKALFGG